jgi:beta-glucosidase
MTMCNPLSKLLASLALLLAVAATAANERSLPMTAEARVEALLQSLTLEQKIGQMVQPEIRYVTPEDMRRYGFGSILNGGGAFPAMNKQAAVADWLALADAFYDASLDRSGGSAGIPTMWGTDAVHGHNNVRGATLFPHNIGLGAARNPELAAAIAAATAREVRATGLDWIFAPTLAVVKDPRWGRSYEGYGSRAELVERYAGGVVRGLQSVNTAASAKHFLGDGGTWRGVDQGDTRLSLDELLTEHAAGYRAAIDAGVLTIMASFNSWNGRKVHGHRQLLTDVLKGQMGFDGVVVSDWNGIGQVEYCSNADCPQAINAGIDVVMVPKDWRPLLANLQRQVLEGQISESRIDDAVRRILRVKLRLGLFDGLRPSERAARLPVDTVGSRQHRILAAQAVRESLVLLKNNHQTLPLNAAARILVAGAVADDITRQSGGWTLTWQGTGNSNSDFPGASSIFDGIRAAVSAAGGQAELSIDGSFGERPDAAVVVIGEQPYAEGEGDVAHLNHSARYPEDLALLRRLQAAGIPVVTVLVTGRPLWVNPELNASGAFVVAWLPGSEGAAVADLLFAAPGSGVDFRGRLPMPWPAQDVNARDADLPVDNWLFPYGYGLSLRSDEFLAGDLDESALAPPDSGEFVVFERRSQPPWIMMLSAEGESDVRMSAAVAEVAGGALRVEAVDYRVQEDARRLIWRGDSPGLRRVYWTHSGGEEWDLLKRIEGEAVLSLQLVVEHAPGAAVQIAVSSAGDRRATLDITAALRAAVPGEWIELLLPARCLSEAGVDLAHATEPLSLATTGTLQLTLADIRYRQATVAEAALACPTILPTAD